MLLLTARREMQQYLAMMQWSFKDAKFYATTHLLDQLFE